jgi:hypothetical protein
LMKGDETKNQPFSPWWLLAMLTAILEVSLDS